MGRKDKKGNEFYFLIDRLCLSWSLRVCKKAIMAGFKSGPGGYFP